MKDSLKRKNQRTSLRKVVREPQEPERAPLRRFQTRAGSPTVSPPPGLPPMRFAALRSVDMWPARGKHWFPTPAVHSSFPTELAVSTVHRPRLSCPNRFILPYASRPFRVLPARTRPTPPGVEHLPWGWPSLFATSARSVLTTGFHSRRLAVRDVSHGHLRDLASGATD
jgi:hypothetical protein